MACETDHLLHAWVFPHHNLILAVAVRADDLIRVLRPCEIAYLGARVDFLDHGASVGVPELDAAVGRPTTGCEKVMLMWRPRNGLHGCNVAAEAVQRCFGKLVPDVKFIVVAARCKLPVLCVPAQAADFLLVTCKLAEILVRGADVSVVDETVTRAGREDVVVPGKGTNPSGVTRHGAETAGFLCIIYLHKAFVRANCYM